MNSVSPGTGSNDSDSEASTPVATGTSEAGRRGYHAEIFLISLAALLLEVSYTRVISFKLFYYYTYLVIGLALLGIGSGGVLMTVSERLKRASTEAIIMWGTLLGGLSTAVGYWIVARQPISSMAVWDYGTRTSVTNLVGLLIICLSLFASFIAVGVMIATLFSRRTEGIGRLYFADLAGAGLACVVVVYLLGSVGPPRTIFLAGAVLGATGLWVALRQRTKVAAVCGVALTGLLVVGVIAPSVAPEVRNDDTKSNVEEAASTSWSPIFRVDAMDLGDQLFLQHDGLPGSVIKRWDGDVDSLDDFGFDEDLRSYPFATPEEDPDKVMIIGAAGGHEILASLYFGAGQIDAIELNPATYELVTDTYEDYSGGLADQPGVNYVNGDGRSFLARSDDAYDVIWYPAPDSYAASNAAQAGAFVLSESYLYTTETVTETYEHLAPDGILAAQFGEVDYDNKPNRTARYVSTVREALEDLGVEDPSSHILVATTGAVDEQGNEQPGRLSSIMVKRTPFTDEEIEQFASVTEDVPNTRVEYAPGDPGDNAVSSILTLEGDELAQWYDDYPYEIGPINDDSPFFWHFAGFGDVIREIGDPVNPFDPEDAIGERVLLLLLAIAVVFAGVFLLLPFLKVRRIWVALPRKGVSFLYFAALGLGFMLFEISLIQRLILFLGYPTYSLTVTLASILIFTGVGAYLSGRFSQEPQRAVRFLLPTVVALTVAYVFGLPALTDGLLSWPIGARLVVAFVVLAPLGICLGTFMPLGLGVVSGLSEHSSEYVAWGWAVNGFASVIGSVLTTVAAMVWGFNVVLVLALGVYLVALASLRALIRTETTADEPVETEEEPEQLEVAVNVGT
ncbi:MAG: hypothetical protein ACRD2C_23600 [Acidimicrobiales bacterium]